MTRNRFLRMCCVCVCVQNLIYSIASKQRCLCTKIAANECYFAYNWIKMKKKEKKKLFCSKQWIWLLFIALPKKENKRKKMFYKRYEGQQFYIVIQIWRIETVGIYQVLHERAKVKKEYQQVIIREKKNGSFQALLLSVNYTYACWCRLKINFLFDKRFSFQFWSPS